MKDLRDSPAARRRVSPGAVDSTPNPRRALRRCARCGREGRNAFRPVLADAGATMWVCTHEGPCVERTRMLRRAAARAAHGRPPQSPIAGFSWDARRACVIGSEAASREAIAAALRDLGSIDVECLDLTRRSIELVGSRDFGLIVADVRSGDPVALLGGLARRLAGARRRGVPILVAHGPEDGALPAIESLVRHVDAERLTRPTDATALLGTLDAVVAADSAGTTARAAS